MKGVSPPSWFPREKIKKAIFWAIEESGVLKGNFLDNIAWIVAHTTKRNFEQFGDFALPVGRIQPAVQQAIAAKDDLVYLKPRIYAKVRGWWQHRKGHPELQLAHFLTLPLVLHFPVKVFADKKRPNRFLFLFALRHLFVSVVEVEVGGRRNELVTIFFVRQKSLKNLKVVWTNKKPLGRTAVPSMLASAKWQSGGCGFSTLRAVQDIYNKLPQRCQAACLYSRIPLKLSDIQVEHPANPNRGDYASSIAFRIHEKLKDQLPTTNDEIITKNQKSNKLQTPNSKFQAPSSKFGSPLQLANFLLPFVRRHAPSWVEKAEVAPPGFINFWLKEKYLIKQANLLLNERKFTQKMAKIGRGKTVVIDYSSPNIAKPFGIGHLRSTNIGQAIYNLYQTLGWKTIGDNHLGDWGTQFGKLIYMIRRTQVKSEKNSKKLKVKNEKLESLTVQDLERLYVEFHRMAEKDPSLEEKGRQWFKKLEEGDPEAKQIWQLCVEISLREFDRIYRLLGVKIDHAFGESFYHFEGWMDKVLADAKARGILKESQGALVVEVPGEKVPAILVKSDGATTYLLRDLAAIKFRVKRWRPDLIVYEVGAEQKLHFRQVFTIAEMLGYLPKERLIHVAHGLIRLKEGKLSTRKGRTIHLEEVIQEGLRRAKALVESSKTARDLDKKQKEAIAKAVAIGGVKFNDLKQEPERDIIFDWDKILALEGYSAPYLQYTHTRCVSVLKKAGVVNAPSPRQQLIFAAAGASGEAQLKTFAPEEVALLRTFYQFPEVILTAAEQFSPHLLAQYLFDLAQRFNLFYQKHRILPTTNRPSPVANFRLFLTATTAQILKKGLGILGIEALERM